MKFKYIKNRNPLQTAVKWGSKYPKNLFLIDGIGALLSAVLLGVVLVELEDIFGIPRSMLYPLALIPCFFVVYNTYCYFIISKIKSTHLKIISLMNLGYSIVSICLLIYHYQKITYFGWIYILLEVFIVTSLAIFELKVARAFVLKQEHKHK